MVEGVAYKATKLGSNMIPLPQTQEEKEAFMKKFIVGN